MSGIIWLASYPKSGNTWLRAFVSNLCRQDGQMADINDLGIPNAASRTLFDETAGLEASDLTDREIERIRPEIYRCLSETARGKRFLKIHDAHTVDTGGRALIPADATYRAIYILRNPLDVAVSFAHHACRPLEWAIATMASDEAAFTCEFPVRNLNQRLLNWSDHVLSWVDHPEFPVHVVRYEDMHQRGPETFAFIAEWCGLSCEPARVEQAMKYSAFGQLQEQERSRGFKERPLPESRFFREGKTGVWKSAMSDTQVAEIVTKHEAVMRRFGYYPF